MPKLPETIELPGAVDLHVHFREPGINKAETIKSGSKVALASGYVLVCDMPNNPGGPTWSEEKLIQKQNIINQTAYIPVATYAGAQPDSDNLDELPKMSVSAIGLKLYGAPTTGYTKDYTAGQFEDIIKTWHTASPIKPIMLHSGRDNVNDFINLIAKRYGHPLHVCHVSGVEQALSVQKAKAKNLPVTSGVCPHHLLKTSHDTLSQGWFARMQPPLMEQGEAEELFKLFATGKIDILETDHAPHTAAAKWTAETNNPHVMLDPKHTSCFGVPGIEFALPLMLYQLQRGMLSLERLVEATSTLPARIIGVKLSPKTKAIWNLTPYRIDEANTKLSGSGWTPYAGLIAGGRLKRLTISGRTVYLNGRMLRTSKLGERGAII